MTRHRELSFVLTVSVLLNFFGDVGIAVAGPTEDLRQAILNPRELTRPQGAVIKEILERHHKEIEWKKLMDVLDTVVQVDHSEYSTAGFLEVLILQRRFDTLRTLIDLGYDASRPLSITLSAKNDHYSIKTRIFDRMIEQVYSASDEGEPFSKAEITDILEFMRTALNRGQAPLYSLLHNDPAGPTVLAAMYAKMGSIGRGDESSDIKPYQVEALTQFIVEAIQGGHIKDVNQPIQLWVTEEGVRKKVEFNLLTLAVENEIPTVVDALVERGADSQIESSGMGPTTAFNSAIFKQDRALILRFLKGGANINRLGRGGLSPRPLHVIPSVRWQNGVAPKFAEFTEWLMSLGLDPTLGSGDPNHDLAGEVLWQMRLEQGSGSPNQSRLLALEVFRRWLGSEKFLAAYQKSTDVRAVQRRSFPDRGFNDRSAYQAALTPILNDLAPNECGDAVARAARQLRNN